MVLQTMKWLAAGITGKSEKSFVHEYMHKKNFINDQHEGKRCCCTLA
jgi:hypothetical protein